MRLRNILLVVENIEASKAFYKEVFGLDVVRDFGENVVLTEGIVLQQRDEWEKAIEQEVTYGGRDAVLYFEEGNWEAFVEKCKMTKVSFCDREGVLTNSWEKQVLRIVDPDGHVIEVAEK
jgi:catechol 2,3-dioxygenase-like lactoylglutathione lyase family enzyme